LRAANSNPTLAIKVFAYDSAAKTVIEENLKKGNTTIRYNNVEFIEPDAPANYDFKTINATIFKTILDKID